MFYFIISKNRAVLANEEFSHHTMAAFAQATRHIFFHRQIDLFIVISQFKEPDGSEFHHDRWTTNNRYRVLNVNIDFIQKCGYNSHRTSPAFIRFINGALSFKLFSIVQPVEKWFVDTIGRSFRAITEDNFCKFIFNIFKSI